MKRWVILIAAAWFSMSGAGAAHAYPVDLQRLDSRDLATVRKALLAFQQNVGGMDEAGRDSAFLEFRGFYYNFISRYNDEVFQPDARLAALLAGADAEARPEVRGLRRKLYDHGLVCYSSEGAFFIGEQPDFLYTSFSYYVSGDLRRFLELRRQELAEGFAEDAGLTISFAQLGERVARWEEFIAQFPQSVLASEAQYHYAMYLSTFLTGLDNSPIFGLTEPRRLKPELRNTYAAYRRDHAGTASGRLVDRFYDLLGRHNFRRTPAVDSFYRENLVDLMPGIQPPTR